MNGGDVWGEVERETVMRSRYWYGCVDRKKVECCLYSTVRMFVEWRIGVVCGRIGMDIGIKFFSLVHVYRIILLLNIWVVILLE